MTDYNGMVEMLNRAHIKYATEVTKETITLKFPNGSYAVFSLEGALLKVDVA